MNDTAKHLKAFRQIIDEIAQRGPALAEIGYKAVSALERTVATGRIDAAIVRGSATLELLTEEYLWLMTEFKTATRNLLGERPRIGESDLDFFARISTTDADGWMRMAANNGLHLEMVTCH
jgi:hypothetical protein